MSQFLKKYSVWFLLLLSLFIFVYPIFSSLIIFSFDPRLFILSLFLIFLPLFGYYSYSRNTWEGKTLLSLFSLVATILFFISTSSQKDLATYASFKTINTYNCAIAHSIIKNSNEDLTSLIAFDYYSINFYNENLGFIYQKLGPAMEKLTERIIYDFTYSNRLLDNIAQLNQPTDHVEKVASAFSEYNRQRIAFAHKVDGELCRRNGA